MHKTLLVDPPRLLRWLPRGERNEIVFLDLEPDFIDENTIRLDIDVVFRPIPIRRGILQSRDYYVGSTGARIVFETFLGRVKDYTRGTALKVDYENTYTRRRSSAAKLAPTVEVGEVKIAGGEVTFEKNTERSFTTRFAGAERNLSDAYFNYGVEWEVKLPEHQLIRDYLMGNLILFVESSWDVGRKEGRIEVRPSDVLFFDSDRRVNAEKKKAITMRFALWKKGIKLHWDSLEINFREVR